jgi:hypothetical protein
MTKIFGHAQSDWDAAKGEARDVMVETPRTTRGTITYGELARRIAAIQFDPAEQISMSCLVRFRARRMPLDAECSA